MRQTEKFVWFPVWSKELESRNRMREFRTYGSVGEASGNRCLYPEKNHELIGVVEEKSQTKFIDIHTDNNGHFSLPKSSPIIQRHKTAISRRNFSKPVQTLLEYDLLNSNVTFFDYGCGQGDDLQALKKMGMDAEGWDPVFNPSNEKRPSDIVNLGFVINVIEDPIERVDVLHQAFDLTKKVLVVSVMLTRVNGEPGGKSYKEYNGPQNLNQLLSYI